MTDRIVCIRCGQDGHRSGQCPWPAETTATPGQPSKRQAGGVRTLADIKDRCVVDDITGCWHWRSARDSNGVPNMQLPALGRVVSLGVAIGTLTTGQPPARGVVWHCTCETRQCANPAHRRAGTRSSQMLAAKLKRSPQTRARMTAGKRRTAKLSQADADEIRGSDLKLTEIMARYGITKGYACEIRAGKRRTPLAAPGSSVFALAGWAT